MRRHAYYASRRRGFTLIEVMIVVVSVAILAAVALPRFGDSTKDANISTSVFNLRQLRGQIELYRQHHDGKLPGPDLSELTVQTNAAGSVGTTAAFAYGPYCLDIPPNPLTDSAIVRIATANPPPSASGADDAGWLYHPATGGLWIDNEELLEE